MNAHRIDRLFQDRRLEEVEPDPRAVIGHWEKALEDWGVCRTASLPTAVAFRLMYTAGFQVATAVLRAAGYRTRGSGGSHHYTTFYALRGLDDAALDNLGAEMDGYRSSRHKALYEPSARIDATEVEELETVVVQLFTVAQARITGQLPELKERIQPPE